MSGSITNSIDKFIKIEVNKHRSELMWALYTARKKMNYTFDSWRNRTDIKRFSNIFLGDLAKNLVKYFILRLLPDIYKNNLVEYDLIRADNFTISDRFDLKVISNNQELSMEIKSSGEKYSRSLDAIYNSRRIMINLDSVHQHFEDILVQVMFIPNNLAFFDNYNDIDKINGITISPISAYFNAFVEQEMIAYLVGWATKDMQEKVKNDKFAVEDEKASAEKRNYANLYVKDGKPMISLVSYIKKFVENANDNPI